MEPCVLVKIQRKSWITCDRHRKPEGQLAQLKNGSDSHEGQALGAFVYPTRFTSRLYFEGSLGRCVEALGAWPFQCFGPGLITHPATGR